MHSINIEIKEKFYPVVNGDVYLCLLIAAVNVRNDTEQLID